ncbi:MAG TPA: hypothetical protein VE715_18020 [Blastocatellia bacterium]|nr:hypothetical protein [Blastocatellia bacterium]
MKSTTGQRGILSQQRQILQAVHPLDPLCDLLALPKDDGIEFSLENSQLREFIEYLRRQEANEAIVAELSVLVDASGFVDPEDYERAAQAAYFARKAKTLPAAA